jgi:AsmA protein
MRKALVALAVLFAAAFGLVYWLLSDPNRFKAEIAEFVHANTGLVVDLSGDLAWRLWPPVQIVARDVSADWSADATEPMLRVATLKLDVDLWPLLRTDGRLVVEGVTLDGVDARLVQKGDIANWMPPGSRDATAPPVPIALPPRETGAASGWEIAAVSLHDSTLRYDLDGDIYDVDIAELVLADLAPGRTSPTRAVLTVAHAGTTYALDARADVATSDDAASIDIRHAVLTGTVRPRGLPFRATFDARYDVRASAVSVSGAAVDVGGVTAKLDVEGSTLRDTPVFRGRIDMPPQSVAALAATTDTGLDVPVSIQASYTATDERVDLDDLDLHYGDTVVKGKAGIRLGGRRAVTFDLRTNSLTIPASNETRGVALGAGGFGAIALAAPTVLTDPSLDEPILPLERVRALDWDGRLFVEQLLYDEKSFPGARIDTRNAGGRVTGTVDLPQFFGGTAHTAWSVDATGTPRWTVKPRLERVNSEEFLAWLGQKYTWAALLLGDADLGMTGNTPRELAATLRGRTTFDGGQGKLDIGIIKEQALALADVAGGTEKVQAWPDILNYRRFTGVWDVDGERHNLRLLLDNLSLALDGTFDPFTEALDVNATVKLLEGTPYPSFVMDAFLMGVDVPVRCTGTLAEPACRPDEAGVRNLLTRALSSDDPATRAKLDQAIDERVPEEYRDAARSLLDLLRQSGAAPQSPSASPQ